MKIIKIIFCIPYYIILAVLSLMSVFFETIALLWVRLGVMMRLGFMLEAYASDHS